MQSQSEPNVLFHQMETECSCKLSCVKCGICVHMFTCSCVDSAIHSTICKHIHLLQLISVPVNTSSTSNLPEAVPISDSIKQYMDVEESTTKVKQTIATNLQVLRNFLDICDDRNTLNAVSKHISSVIGVVKANDACTTTELYMRKRPAPNDNSDRQLRFYSTKKKTSKSASLSKPTSEEQLLNRSCNQQMYVCVVFASRLMAVVLMKLFSGHNVLSVHSSIIIIVLESNQAISVVYVVIKDRCISILRL